MVLNTGRENQAVFPSLFFRLFSLRIERGVKGVDIFAIHTLLGAPKGIGEALVVHDLALTQKLDGVTHVGIVGQTENVVIGDTRLLLCCYHVFATFFRRWKIKISLVL